MKKLTVFILAAFVLSGFYACKKDISDFNSNDHSINGEYGFFLLPMAISPNGDNLNEEYMFFYCGIESNKDEVTCFELEAKQNSKKVFSTEDQYFKWNGNDPSGTEISGIVNIKLKLGLNGGSVKTYRPLLYIVRDGCISKDLTGFMFADMIDARYGAVYNTQETFCQ
jgi:hypothetical protein